VRLWVFYGLTLLVCSCASGQEILGLKKEAAAEKIRSGDTSFILEAELPAALPDAISALRPLARIHPHAPFYAGLLVRQNLSRHLPGKTEEGRALPEKAEISRRASLLLTLALESSSLVIQNEAALLLIPRALEDERLAAEALSRLNKAKTGGAALTLKAACFYRLGRFADLAALPLGQGSLRTELSGPEHSSRTSSWDKIIPLLGRLRANQSGQKAVKAVGPKEGQTLEPADHQHIKAFFWDAPASTVIEGTAKAGAEAGTDSAWAWALAETGRLAPDFWSPGEKNILEARAAVAGFDYRRAAPAFRAAIEKDRSFFLAHPALISDAGRAFQYSPGARDEGAALFAGWLPGEVRPGKTPGSPITTLARFRILFFAGRIERQKESWAKSSEYFREALESAPDSEQADACLWYILMNALQFRPENAAKTALEIIPKMYSPPYFNDVMDRLSRQLVGARQWKTMLEIFDALDPAHGASKAQYAWILGRVVEEGLLLTERKAEEFFKTAFEEKKAPIYYRVMSASRLGAAVVPDNQPAGGETSLTGPGGRDITGKAAPVEPDKTKIGEKAEFLLAFFDFNAGCLAPAYIKTMEAGLSIPELRPIARILAEKGFWDESLNMVSRYMDRSDYKTDREDLFLFYPRHFKELIEKNAREASLSPEILFGLIRTESYFMPRSVSRSGAEGLTQLMRSTALEMAGRIARSGGEDFGNEEDLDLLDPELNLRLGAYYLRYLIDRMSSPMTALLAYNGGMMRVRRWQQNAAQGGALPEDLFLETVEFPETREYGRRVLGASAVYAYLYYGMSMEAVIADIYR
jgi:soluble lytic murein transglycosylase